MNIKIYQTLFLKQEQLIQPDTTIIHEILINLRTRQSHRYICHKQHIFTGHLRQAASVLRDSQKSSKVFELDQNQGQGHLIQNYVIHFKAHLDYIRLYQYKNINDQRLQKLIEQSLKQAPEEELMKRRSLQDAVTHLWQSFYDIGQYYRIKALTKIKKVTKKMNYFASILQ